METDNEAQMEGYLHKRFRSGIVKTLKKKWCVLKEGEIRWYQSKDVCQQNVAMYQDILPINSVQAVRPVDNHGLEVVTQHHVYTLFASCGEDQKRWHTAIFEALKDKRPRSMSSPDEGSKDADLNRKRSSTGPKVSISRILSGFHRKSTADTQGPGQSQFYLDKQSHQPTFAEIGIQADLQRAPQCETVQEGGEREEEDLVDDVFERQDAAPQPSASDSPQHKMGADQSVKEEHSTKLDPGGSVHLGGNDLLPGNSGSTVQPARDSEEEVSSDVPQDEYYPEQEDGMHELELMLRQSVACENGHEDSDVSDSEVSDVDDDDDDTEDEEDREDETQDGNINKTQDGVSGFELLEALLQKS